MKSALPLAAVWAACACGLLFLSGCVNQVPADTVSEGGRPTLPPLSPPPDMVETAVTQPIDPSLLSPSSTAYRLGPGDRMDIELVSDPTTRETVTVGPDGKIYYFLLPGTDVWGLTLSQARTKIADDLRKYIRQRPVVSLVLRDAESQKVWILGRVTHPGAYSLAEPTTVLDAISQAGGLASGSGTPTPVAEADLSRSFLVRQGQMLPIDFEKLLAEGDLSQNIYLQPGDFIFLPAARAAQVHVIGAVFTPRSVRMTGALTLAEAVADAGGTLPDAALAYVAILRGSLSHPQMAIVRFDHIVKGKTRDVRLAPGDIVYVPFTRYRTLERYANLILDTFGRTVGVNEGARAVSNNAEGVGVSVSVSP